MKNLHGLRLNCWLASMLPSVFCALALLWLGHRVQEQHQEVFAAGARLALSSYAAAEQGDLSILLTQSWDAVARLRVDDEGELLIEESQGDTALAIDDPHPLILGVTQARSWRLDNGRWAVVCPMHHPDGRFSALLYGELTAPPLQSPWFFAWVASVVLILGALMAWYLARRIYAPVDMLCEQAEAALQGRALPMARGSVETQAFASAVSALAEAYIERKTPTPISSASPTASSTKANERTATSPQ